MFILIWNMTASRGLILKEPLKNIWFIESAVKYQHESSGKSSCLESYFGQDGFYIKYFAKMLRKTELRLGNI